MTSCCITHPQETQSDNPERLIMWLLDHTNLEVPDLATPAPPPAPEPAPSVEPPAAEKARGEGNATDSSSDTTDYSEESGEEEEPG